jgi:hypothetical protein
MKNLEAVLEVIQTVTNTTEFPKVALFSGTDTLFDQANTFREADIVVAVHGAALTNVMFMQPCSGELMNF